MYNVPYIFSPGFLNSYFTKWPFGPASTGVADVLAWFMFYLSRCLHMANFFVQLMLEWPSGVVARRRG